MSCSVAIVTYTRHQTVLLVVAYTLYGMFGLGGMPILLELGGRGVYFSCRWSHFIWSTVDVRVSILTTLVLPQSSWISNYISQIKVIFVPDQEFLKLSSIFSILHYLERSLSYLPLIKFMRQYWLSFQSRTWSSNDVGRSVVGSPTDEGRTYPLQVCSRRG